MLDKLSNHAIFASLVFLLGKGIGLLAVVATFAKMKNVAAVLGVLWFAMIVAAMAICIHWFVRYRSVDELK